MKEEIDNDENVPHKASEVICLNCGYIWVAVRPVNCATSQLECPRCHKQGYTSEAEKFKDNNVKSVN